jgi:hypothetical protein
MARHLIHAGAVEAEPVDDAFVLRQTEHARLEIARLRLGRDAADLDEPEALAEHGMNHFSLLVETGGESDRIGEILVPQPDGKQAVIGLPPLRHQAELERADHQIVGALGRQRTEQWLHKAVVDHEGVRMAKSLAGATAMTALNGISP